jgi:hypothetical protein
MEKRKTNFLISPLYRAFLHRENPTFKIWQRMRFVVVKKLLRAENSNTKLCFGFFRRFLAWPSWTHALPDL